MSDFAAAVERAYAEGRRDQRCPACGQEEAGGWYCSLCLRPVHPDDWTADTAKSRAGRAGYAARIAGGAGFRGVEPRKRPDSTQTPSRRQPRRARVATA